MIKKTIAGLAAFASLHGSMAHAHEKPSDKSSIQNYAEQNIGPLFSAEDKVKRDLATTLQCTLDDGSFNPHQHHDGNRGPNKPANIRLSIPTETGEITTILSKNGYVIQESNFLGKPISGVIERGETIKANVQRAFENNAGEGLITYSDRHEAGKNEILAAHAKKFAELCKKTIS